MQHLLTLTPTSAANATRPAICLCFLPSFRIQLVGIHKAFSVDMPTTLHELLSVPTVQMLISTGAGPPNRGLLFSMQMEAVPVYEMVLLRRES